MENFCKHGHEMTPDNTFALSNGWKACATCDRAAQARYRKSEKGLKNRFKLDLRRFNITPEQYDEMLQKQDGVCAICKSKCTFFKRLSVDHNHKTEIVRELLCNRCNLLIGKAEESAYILESAAAYLRKHGQQCS